MKTKSNSASQSSHELGLHGMSRRRMLRAVGLGMALPALESLAPRSLMNAVAASEATRAAATTSTGAPLRTAFLYFPNGVIHDAWWPETTGSDFELNRTMKPLAQVKEHIQVLGGLSDLSANSGGDGGGDHARANATFLTGVRIKKTGGSDFQAGISADQVMARQIGLQSPFRSLELSCDTIVNAGACDTGYACIYQHNLAWSSPTTPLTPENNPRLMFERLFGQGSPEERVRNRQARQLQKRSILDFLSQDARKLEKDLSGRDRQKMDEYTTGVREIEQRIEMAEQSRGRRKQPSQDAPEGIPSSYQDYVRLMFDMLLLAFETDSTRVATFMIAGDGSNREFSDIGVNDGHHNLSHHGNKSDWMESVAKIDHWYIQQLAYFLERMQAAQDIDGKSLLHNSQIVYGCGNSDGNRHTHSNLPVILAGAAGGMLNPGRYTKFNDEPITNLYLSMMDRVGGEVQERFGDSTGRLANL